MTRTKRVLRTGWGRLPLLLLSLIVAACAGSSPDSSDRAPTAPLTPAGSTTSALPSATAMPTPTQTLAPSPQPPGPSPAPSRVSSVAPKQTARVTATAPAPSTAPSEAEKLPLVISGSDRSRVCVGMPEGELADFDWGSALPSLYVPWRVVSDPPDAEGARLVQMVRTPGGAVFPSLSVIQAAARRNPGSLWLIGNEPDAVLQDNATPEQYAESYGIAYRAITEADPSAQVAIAGVAQPTPLRMEYLDRVLAAYRQQYGEEMPVDAWNIHAYVLREERGSWGVGIPPGFEVDRGQLYEIEDHADLTIWRQQIADFRRWMAERGQRDTPLIVSEYGILMPNDYGFPPEAVGRFMVDTFDYFLSARDEQTGYPSDDHRLVQTFCWFSAATAEWPTSNLFDPVTRAITPVGEVFRAYVSALK